MVELAAFASIFLYVLSLLIRYGLSMNYAQSAQMRTFRLAQKSGYDKLAGGSTLSLIEDKLIPDVTSPEGIYASRTEAGGQAGVTWSSHLNVSPEWDNETEAPRYEYFLNGRQYVFTTGAWNIRYAVYDTWGYIPFRFKVDDPNDTHLWDGSLGSDGIYWYWVNLSNPWDYYDSEDDAVKYDLDADGKLEPVTAADIDGDDKEEMIYDVQNKSDERIFCVRSMDNQLGALDFTVDSANLEDNNKERMEGGLFPGRQSPVPWLGPGKEPLPGYGDYKSIEVKPDTYFRRMETPAYYNTITKVDVKEDTIRTFKLNEKIFATTAAAQAFCTELSKWHTGLDCRVYWAGLPGSPAYVRAYVTDSLPKEETTTWYTSPIPGR